MCRISLQQYPLIETTKIVKLISKYYNLANVAPQTAVFITTAATIRRRFDIITCWEKSISLLPSQEPGHYFIRIVRIIQMIRIFTQRLVEKDRRATSNKIRT